MLASKQFANSCILGLCILQDHAIAAPKPEGAPFRKEGDASPLLDSCRMYEEMVN